MTNLLHRIDQISLGIAAALVTVLLCILNFKSRSIHNLQVQLLEQKYLNDKQAIDAGIKKDDDETTKLKGQFDSAYSLYIATHKTNPS